MMKSFENKVCVVTGGAAGIGLATAKLFAAQGGNVIIACRSDARDLARKLDGHYVRTDVSVEADVERLFTEIADQFGRVDVLVNNAGIMATAEIEELAADEFDRHLAVNVRGVLLGTKYGSRLMSGGGAIVNSASVAGQIGLSGYASYSTSKAAIISLTQVAAIEYGARGIRVNCVCPSSVETPMLAAQENGDLEREISRLASPLGFTIQPEHVADVIAFLASPAAAAITGQAINVDAGMTAGYSDPLLEAVAATLVS
ncbi:SDR family NAD(P)-dependent oxidoreductase [Gordonia sp. SL306]|uniref:SDR family NAD(P)-dependent oxidoreductase n=1 Tax=Gordonia sp. SL306 TaxID=2995145 RepID=UPI00226D73D6|nr:SDR family oxidoreductase [Gordonia sp. SL306]WAC57729.1 SDR family NAD(P)-dependent oxidoreductase [Gordonia sp. SL306]